MLTVRGAPFDRILRRGASGLDVGALQRCLHRWNPRVRPYWEWPGGHGESGFFGDPMTQQVKAFQRAHTQNHAGTPIPQTGVIGPLTFTWLAQYADDLAVEMLQEHYRSTHPLPKTRQLIIERAHFSYLHRYNLPYTQTAARWEIVENLPALATQRVSGDCSSSVTAWSLWGQRAARVEPHDPNHLAFHAGYTGTQIFHGSAVSLSNLDLADFVFYGSSYSLAGITHVALYAGAGLVYTNGHFPMQLAPVHYRGDARGARRYPFPEA